MASIGPMAEAMRAGKEVWAWPEHVRVTRRLGREREGGKKEKTQIRAEKLPFMFPHLSSNLAISD